MSAHDSGHDYERRRALLVDAFAAAPLAGSVAGVVPDAAGLDEATTRAVAAELGASETAFCSPSDDAGHRLRVVSPGADHREPRGTAMVAAHAHLTREGRIEAGDHAVETPDGTVDVTVTESGVVLTPAGEATVDRVDVDYDRVADALSLDPAGLRDVGADLPVAVVETDRRGLVVPVNFLERLGEAGPTEALAALLDDHDVPAVHAFTFDAVGREATCHARTFVADPDREVSATASSGAAVAGYLHAVEAFDDEFPDEIRVEQGHYLDRPGVVRARVDDGRVAVGGRATTALDARVAVPDESDDEIVEA